MYEPKMLTTITMEGDGDVVKAYRSMLLKVLADFESYRQDKGWRSLDDWYVTDEEAAHDLAG